MKYLLLLIIICLYCQTNGQGKKPYTLYDGNGKKITYAKMLKQIQKSNIVLFGELHNNPIAHWLQYELAKDLNEKHSLMLGAEMIESDNQNILNDYLSSKIDDKALDTLGRLWSNYKTDYAPLVNFAKAYHLQFIGTNIPRRYARLVHKSGGLSALDSLPSADKQWIAPLPIAYDASLPGYKNIAHMMGDHGSNAIAMAQAIKDATMAHFILKNYLPNHLFLHFNGAYHSNNYEGILWYLKKQKDTLNYLTISTVSQENLNKLENDHKGKADFIICVDSDMTKTY